MDTGDRDERTDGVWIRRLVAAAVVVAVLALLAIPVWRENERRYDALRITGCSDVVHVTDGCPLPRHLCRAAWSR